MRLLVDDLVCQIAPNRGIHKVWASLLKSLRRESVFSEIIILSRTGMFDSFGDRVVHIPRYDGLRPETESLQLSQLALAFENSVFMSTYYTRVFSRPTIALVHDCIPEKLGLQTSTPGWRQRTKAIHEADGLLTVSESTYEDLVKFFPESKSRASSGLIGADLEFFSEVPEGSEAQIVELGLRPGGYVLNVGSRKLYKNGEKLIREWRTVDNDLDLVLIGGEDLISSQKPFLRLVPEDSNLASLYTHAAATVISSSLEGYGLPARESILMGTPVISLPGVVSEASFGKAIEITDIIKSELVQACTAARDQKLALGKARSKLVISNQNDWTAFISQLANLCEEVLRQADSWTAAQKKYDLESDCYNLSIAENR